MEGIIPKDCELKYFEMFGKFHNGEITQKEFDDWYNEHCKDCYYMNEVCMYFDKTIVYAV